MLIRYAPMHSPCDPAVVSADVGGHPEIGEGGMTQHRCVNVRLREAAGLMHLPTGRQRAAGGQRPGRPFALVTRCQGALENE
jgi:hypothetical protein